MPSQAFEVDETVVNRLQQELNTINTQYAESVTDLSQQMAQIINTSHQQTSIFERQISKWCDAVDDTSRQAQNLASIKNEIDDAYLPQGGDQVDDELDKTLKLISSLKRRAHHVLRLFQQSK
ncbi:hypothetical protein MP228_001566 [Amoeboaphelidium protococcarum]|nr:hypothetical protein MP228_001566 [Amoeboaphelidium protococcarum]